MAPPVNPQNPLSGLSDEEFIQLHQGVSAFAGSGSMTPEQATRVGQLMPHLVNEFSARTSRLANFAGAVGQAEQVEKEATPMPGGQRTAPLGTAAGNAQFASTRAAARNRIPQSIRGDHRASPAEMDLLNSLNKGIISPDNPIIAGTAPSVDEINKKLNAQPARWEENYPLISGAYRGVMGVNRDARELVSSFTSPVQLGIMAGTMGEGEAANVIGKVASAFGAVQGAEQMLTPPQKGETNADLLQRRLYGGLSLTMSAMPLVEKGGIKPGVEAEPRVQPAGPMPRAEQMELPFESSGEGLSAEEITPTQAASDPPVKWAHGTAATNVEGILKRGIEPKAQNEMDNPKGFVSTNRNYAKQYPTVPPKGGRAVVVGESPAGFLDTTDTATTHEAIANNKTIPPDHIQQVRIYDEQDRLVRILDNKGEEMMPDTQATVRGPSQVAAMKNEPASPQPETPRTGFIARNPGENYHEYVKRVNASGTAVMHGGDTMDGVAARAKIAFPDGKYETFTYENREGKVTYGIRKASQATTPGASSPTETATSARASAASDLASLQADSKKFEETITKGEHGDFHAQETIPMFQKFLDSESSRNELLKDPAARLRRLNSAYQVLVKDPQNMAGAIDTLRRRGEQGFAGGNRRRYTPQEVDLISKTNVWTNLSKYENMTDSQLKLSRASDRLQEPSLVKAVQTLNDPQLASRYEALMQRAGTAKYEKADPIRALTRTIAGREFTPGDIEKGILQERYGNLVRDREVLTHRLQEHIDAWDKRPAMDAVKFVDQMENGDFNAMSQQDATIGNTLRTLLDDRRDSIRNLGTGYFDKFIENYFPHLWNVRLSKAQQVIRGIMGRSSFEGPKDFLKARDHETFVDGLAAGLEPLTYNPVKMALYRLHEMDKFLSAQKAVNEMVVQGIAKFVPSRESVNMSSGIGGAASRQMTLISADPPTGWLPLDDRHFIQSNGRYYAPPDAAKIFNDAHAPGLRGHVLFDVVRGYNNFANQLNLGFSMFHAVETAFNGSVSDLSTAIQRAARFDPKAVLPAARSLVPGVSALRQLYNGQRMFAEYMEPGRFAEYSREVDGLVKAGGRATMPEVYKNQALDSLRTAIKDIGFQQGIDKMKPLSRVPYRAAATIMEQMAKPLMEWFVPRVKLGVFYDMAHDIFKRNQGAPPEIIRSELSKAWDSVDNRFGQLVYERRFWNPVGKDLSMLAFRSVGWNVGTTAELGGGVLDFGKDFKNYAKQATAGKFKPSSNALSPRTAYAMALPVMALMTGSLLNYMYTGEKPQNITDMLWPRTGKTGEDGKPNRVYLKTYMHDMVSLGRDPSGTISHKASPILSQAFDVFARNADYYGKAILAPDDKWANGIPSDLNGALDLGQYFIKANSPLSLQNFVYQRDQGETLSTAASSSFAILPAPKWVGRSPAEQLAYDYAVTEMPVGPKDSDTFNRELNLRQLESRYYGKQISGKDLVQAAKAGKISYDDIDKIYDDDRKPPLERYFDRLPLDRAVNVWKKASGAERKRLQSSYYDKIDSLDNYPNIQREKILQEIKEAGR